MEQNILKKRKCIGTFIEQFYTKATLIDHHYKSDKIILRKAFWRFCKHSKMDYFKFMTSGFGAKTFAYYCLKI